MPRIKGVYSNQTTLFPESIDNYTTSDDPVRVIDDLPSLVCSFLVEHDI